MTKENRSWGIPLGKVEDARHLTYGKSQIFFVALRVFRTICNITLTIFFTSKDLLGCTGRNNIKNVVIFILTGTF